jgi:hypothetical protein
MLPDFIAGCCEVEVTGDSKLPATTRHRFVASCRATRNHSRPAPSMRPFARRSVHDSRGTVWHRRLRRPLRPTPFRHYVARHAARDGAQLARRGEEDRQRRDGAPGDRDEEANPIAAGQVVQHAGEPGAGGAASARHWAAASSRPAGPRGSPGSRSSSLPGGPSRPSAPSIARSCATWRPWASSRTISRSSCSTSRCRIGESAAGSRPPKSISGSRSTFERDGGFFPGDGTRLGRRLSLPASAPAAAPSRATVC